MSMPVILRFLRFHFRDLFQSAPVMFGACCVAAGTVLLTLIVMDLGQFRLREKQTELAMLRDKLLNGNAVSAGVSAQVAPELPWFDSARVVEQFSTVADESKLTLDEVSYMLEESAQRPYLRYRITLSVSASYPAIRQFVGDIPASMHHVDLDNISCVRSDIAVTPLTCELVFSAFYRKDANDQ